MFYLYSKLLLRVALLSASIFFLIFIFYCGTIFYGEEQQVLLATSFLRGKLYFLDGFIPNHDTVFFEGHYFWPLGPFPAIVLMPFVYMFGLVVKTFYQVYLQIFFTLGVFFMCFKLARIFKYNKEDSFYLAFAFCFASVYQLVALVSWSWYFPQAIAVFLLLLSIYEFLTKRRFWSIGIIYGLVFMTRFTAGVGILFFILYIFVQKNFSLSIKFRNMIFLLLPVIVSGLLLLWYNYARFRDPFNNGYALTNYHSSTPEERFEVIHYGLFQIRNIPTNFYYYFVNTLDPVRVEFKTKSGASYVSYVLKPPYINVRPPGTSFFVVSPIFLYLILLKFRKKMLKLVLIPIFVILFTLLTYYWPGSPQVGPRYLLDLLPFLFLLLLSSFKNYKLTTPAKLIIIFSSFFDLYLFIRVFWYLSPPNVYF